MGSSPWGRKESDMTEQLTLLLFFSLRTTELHPILKHGVIAKQGSNSVRGGSGFAPYTQIALFTSCCQKPVEIILVPETLAAIGPPFTCHCLSLSKILKYPPHIKY